MRTRKYGKWAVLAAFLFLLVLGMAGAGAAKASGSGLTTAGELDGKVLAGITGMQLSTESAEVFFDTLLGISLSGYTSADTVPELLYELESGRADAIWCPDVTADYLLGTKEGEKLCKLLAPEDTAGGAEDGGRLEFALAMKPSREKLCEELNEAITEMQEDGTLERLLVAYVTADEPLDAYLTHRSGKRKTLLVGVTGTLPPLDLYDANGVPCGFSAAFLSELEGYTAYQFEFVRVTPKDAFTALSSGKIDLLFGFGTSKNTTPGKKEYIATKGYYTMREYAYLTLR